MIYLIHGRGAHNAPYQIQQPRIKGEVIMSKKTTKAVEVITAKTDAVAWVTENGFPKADSKVFTEDKVLKKFYKKLDTEVLEAWSAELGAEYKACPDNDSIHRMRVAMSILYTFFPKETKSKPKSKYADYSLEQLVELALENGVVVEDTDDMRIMRMRLIMGLRANKVIE